MGERETPRFLTSYGPRSRESRVATKGTRETEVDTEPYLHHSSRGSGYQDAHVAAHGARSAWGCAALAFTITGVAWLLTLPVYGKGECPYTYYVVGPLSMSVFLPGWVSWKIVGSRVLPQLGFAGLILCTFLVNSAIGCLFGILLHQIERYLARRLL
jgi:hypothetical protein